MFATLDYIIMVPMVYLAVAWCVIGIAWQVRKVLRSPKHPTTLKIFPDTRRPLPAAIWDGLTMSSARKHAPVFWFFLMLFHLGILAVFLEHLDLFPWLNIMPAASPDVITYGAAGVAVIVSVLYFLFRRLRGVVRELSVPADYLLLFLLLLIFITGATISWAISWGTDGFMFTKQNFGTYLNNLLKFNFKNPNEVLSGAHYVVVVIHVFLANLFLLLLPFSKVMHLFFALPLNKVRRG
jgi:nitrate reductase gamma subunit